MSLIAGLAPPTASLGGLRRRWTVAIVVGELVGFIPPAVTGATLVALGAPEAVLVVGLVIAGVVEGLVIGTTQAIVVGARWPQLSQRSWIVATAVATGLAWVAGMGGSALIGSGAVPVAAGVAIVVSAAVVALASMGYLQWRVLRTVVDGSIDWVLVTAGAWLVGVLIPVVALSAVPNSWPAAAYVLVAVVAAMGMGLTVGLITGGALERYSAAEDRPRATTATPDLGARVEALERRFVLAVAFLWTVVSCFVVESVIVGLAALPSILFFQWHLGLSFGPTSLRLAILAAALLPAYGIFAVLFMTLSAGAAKLLGWRPPTRADLRIAELPIELRNWARYSIMNHLVHVAAGPVFRSTPVWIWYMRRNGAKIGKHVWVNSLQVGDDCLLDFGDEVVIGAGVHLSGHTVERGMVRLAPVTLGRGTVVGVGAHIGVGVTTGEETQIGSMSVVPKYTTLEGGRTYAGIPARPIDGAGS